MSLFQTQVVPLWAPLPRHGSETPLSAAETEPFLLCLLDDYSTCAVLDFVANQPATPASRNSLGCVAGTDL